MVAFGVIPNAHDDVSGKRQHITEYKSLDNLKIIFKENERLKSELSTMMEMTVKDRHS
jgi:hypothetical protein